MLGGYREDGGFIFPAGDAKIARYLRESLGDIDIAVRHCRGRSIAVQAGGNCGLWPLRLSELFAAVYTFEPDPINFMALAYNTADAHNVIRFQAALGDGPAFIDMNRQVKNCGAFYVGGPGILPTMRVDDLGLTGCDLLYLDIEGREMAALDGAMATIAKFKPVIGFEDKGLCQRFGVEPGAAENWLTIMFGYRVVDRVGNGNDVIMTI